MSVKKYLKPKHIVKQLGYASFISACYVTLFCLYSYAEYVDLFGNDN